MSKNQKTFLFTLKIEVNNFRRLEYIDWAYAQILTGLNIYRI